MSRDTIAEAVELLRHDKTITKIDASYQPDGTPYIIVERDQSMLVDQITAVAAALTAVNSTQFPDNGVAAKLSGHLVKLIENMVNDYIYELNNGTVPA